MWVSLKNMIESIEDAPPASAGRPDRLTALLGAMMIRARPGLAGANAWVLTGADAAAASGAHDNAPGALALAPGGAPPAELAPALADGRLLAAARLEFGGVAETGDAPASTAALDPALAHALPPALWIAFGPDDADMRAAARLFVSEASEARCGGPIMFSRLAEVLLVHALRRAIAHGLAEVGVLAGLAHPNLQRALVAMHDAPARDWRVEDLAQEAGLSRAQFMAAFRRVVGVTPMRHLSEWRLSLARRALADGARVGPAARLAGFTSAEGFSRAFARRYGASPMRWRQLASGR